MEHLNKNETAAVLTAVTVVLDNATPVSPADTNPLNTAKRKLEKNLEEYNA